MKRRSSLRRMDAPMPVCALNSTSLLHVHRLCARQDGGDDILVARATAYVAFQPATYVALTGICMAIRKIDGAHDHARRAEAALQAVVEVEGLLHGVQVGAGGPGETFNR